MTRATSIVAALLAASAAAPAEKLEVLSQAAAAACDKNDGLADGLIGDPRACKFDPAAIACKSGDGPDCLSAGQLAMA